MQCAALLSSSRYAAISSNSHEVCLWHFCDMVARCCAVRTPLGSGQLRTIPAAAHGSRCGVSTDRETLECSMLRKSALRHEAELSEYRLNI
jgi:hypothetical protein